MLHDFAFYAATMSVAGHMEKSTEVMQSMSKLISMPQVAEVARKMGKEMMKVTKNKIKQKYKTCWNISWLLYSVAYSFSPLFVQAGIISDMVDDTFSSLDSDTIDAEADAEVDKVLYELTEGILGQAGNIKGKNLKQQEEEAVPQESKEIDEMKERLQKLG